MLSEDYYEKLVKTLPALPKNMPEVKKAAEMVIEALNRGKKIFVTDRYEVIDSEVEKKPGGLLLFRSLSHSGEKMMEGDVLILSTFEPENEKDMAIIKNAHDLGAKVISISPSGRLANTADLALTDPSENMNTVLDLTRVKLSFAPLNGIFHVLLVYMIETETVERLLEAGKKPAVVFAEYLDGGADKLLESRKKFASQGY
jgi:uncharacterized phosphosugar-binding protein